jgi:hypothetical protein
LHLKNIGFSRRSLQLFSKQAVPVPRRTTLRTHWGKSPYETQLGP